jgi:hypothetical protein
VALGLLLFFRNAPLTLQTVHDFAADNSFRHYHGLDGKTPRPFKWLHIKQVLILTFAVFPHSPLSVVRCLLLIKAAEEPHSSLPIVCHGQLTTDY